MNDAELSGMWESADSEGGETDEGEYGLFQFGGMPALPGAFNQYQRIPVKGEYMYNYRHPREALNEMMDEIRTLNQEKGWRDTINSLAEYVALLHSEASEVLEAWRDYHNVLPQFDGAKPVGVDSEIADVFIRLLDMCDIFGIDLYRAYDTKMAYNRTRPRHHGGRTL